MKKNIITKPSRKANQRMDPSEPRTIGVDLGDRTSVYSELNAGGDIVREGSIATTKKGMLQHFGAMPRTRIAIKAERIRRGSAGC